MEPLMGADTSWEQPALVPSDSKVLPRLILTTFSIFYTDRKRETQSQAGEAPSQDANLDSDSTCVLAPCHWCPNRYTCTSMALTHPFHLKLAMNAHTARVRMGQEQSPRTPGTHWPPIHLAPHNFLPFYAVHSSHCWNSAATFLPGSLILSLLLNLAFC